LVDGVVYFGSTDHHLYAFDAATGEQRWVLDLGDAVNSSPAVVGGTIYVGAGNFSDGKPGYVYAIGSGGTAATPADIATP
jgi:outer membrane protein assembly factor BamB